MRGPDYHSLAPALASGASSVKRSVGHRRFRSHEPRSSNRRGPRSWARGCARSPAGLGAKHVDARDVFHPGRADCAEEIRLGADDLRWLAGVDPLTREAPRYGAQFARRERTAQFGHERVLRFVERLPQFTGVRPSAFEAVSRAVLEIVRLRLLDRHEGIGPRAAGYA